DPAPAADVRTKATQRRFQWEASLYSYASSDGCVCLSLRRAPADLRRSGADRVAGAQRRGAGGCLGRCVRGGAAGGGGTGSGGDDSSAADLAVAASAAADRPGG